MYDMQKRVLVRMRMWTVLLNNKKSFCNSPSSTFSLFEFAARPINSSFCLFVAKIRKSSIVHQQGITVSTPHECRFFHLNWKQNEIKKKKHYYVLFSKIEETFFVKTPLNRQSIMNIINCFNAFWWSTKRKTSKAILY